MIVFAWYLLKVLIVSGILCGYYFLALKDKVFHKWNRFYLLFTIVLSLLLPFVSINLIQPPTEKGTVIKVLQAVTVQDEIIIELGKRNLLTTDTLIIAGYSLISLVFIAVLLLTFVRIYRIKKRYPSTEVEGINFINTDAKGTPFSFFNSIFWNRSIDLHSVPGQQIFNHEIAHVKEKHSYDKIFINAVLLFFWANPFFWLIRKELNMIHEFVADKAALEDGDVNAFAEMILSSVYAGQQLSITNNFFYSPVKRRLIMLLKNKNPKVNYVSRLLVLPLAAIVFMAFALKLKTAKPAHIYNGEAITVVIDAGHGGSDAGAMSNNINEKDLTLAIAKEIKSLNGNDKINIILTRDQDQYHSVKDKASFANRMKADLFISIHVDGTTRKENNSGMSILIPKNGNAYLQQSKLLGSSIIHSFKDNYPFPIETKLQQRQTGIWVLSAVNCPSILIETGYITTPKDVDYLSKTENQKTIAGNILKGIENYAAQNTLSKVNASVTPDTIPDMYYQNKKVTGLSVQSKVSTVKVTYADGSTETISKGEVEKRGFVLPPPPPPPAPPGRMTPLLPPTPPAPPKLPENTSEDDAHAGNDTIIVIADKFIIGDGYKGNGRLKNQLILLDGKEISKDEMNRLPSGSIGTLTLIEGKEVKQKYGRKADDGVIEISSKKVERQPLNHDTIPDKIFTRVEQDAEFPGGKTAWSKYITRQIMATKDSLTEKDFGTCIVKFIVDVNGNVFDVRATTMKGSTLAKIATDAIQNGPKWIPAMQNGRKVNAYRLQPITLTNPVN